MLNRLLVRQLSTKYSTLLGSFARNFKERSGSCSSASLLKSKTLEANASQSSAPLPSLLPASLQARHYSKSSDSRAFRWPFLTPMPPTGSDAAIETIKKIIREHEIVVFTSTTCSYCKKLKELLTNLNFEFHVVTLDEIENGDQLRVALAQYLNKGNEISVPQLFAQFGAKHIGGYSDTYDLHKKDRLIGILRGNKPAPSDPEPEGGYMFDYVVVGGGSGGVASAQEAASLGKKVALFDYIVPTPKGTKWGLGGTCVNVGCIPKKLMHQAAILGHNLEESVGYGWEVDHKQAKNNWSTLVERVQSHVKSINFKYRVGLRSSEGQVPITYLNQQAQFVGPHKVQTITGEKKEITGRYFLVAVGCRPTYPPDLVGGREHCITSDDLFSLKYPPGKTLVVGASYVALECAGFLHGVGFPVTLAVRSIFLRGFDQQIGELIGADLEHRGVRILRPTVPKKIEKIEDGNPGRYAVTLEVRDADGSNPRTLVEEFNTILIATGRSVSNQTLGLEKIGVSTNRSNGKLIVNEEDRTNVPWLYSVGDVSDGPARLELTPVAIEAGVLLARRLFNNSKTLTEYDKVPTAVFTPLEYGSVGLPEEEAIDKYGGENIEVYHLRFSPLEWKLREGDSGDGCYMKLVCLKTENERVVGLHYLGPHAGEVTQGYAVALKLNATKSDFDRTIGIHPTSSEQFTTLSLTKSSGKDATQKKC